MEIYFLFRWLYTCSVFMYKLEGDAKMSNFIISREIKKRKKKLFMCSGRIIVQ